MLKKRLIFTLLYDQGDFMLSRNFRLQKVGDLSWLKNNYDFSHISYSIDELVVLDVSRGTRDLNLFTEALRILSQGCFVPIAAGGGVNSVETAFKLLRAGADKIIVNTPLYNDSNLLRSLAEEFGQQCVVGSVDIKMGPENAYSCWSNSGQSEVVGNAPELLKKIFDKPIGEVYINSMDRDGTGQGLDLGLLDLLPQNVGKPVILAGGVGNADHLADGFKDERVDAVATANLFNFVGSGLRDARQSLISMGVVLPLWDIQLLEERLGIGESRDSNID
jgi:cyclase